MIKEENPEYPVFRDLFQAFPFLEQLPVDLLKRLDTDTFYFPNESEFEIRKDLEKKLLCHIMTYKAGISPCDSSEKIHLCRLLQPTMLTPSQQKILRNYESVSLEQGVILVAYRNPLSFRDGEKESKE